MTLILFLGAWEKIYMKKPDKKSNTDLGIAQNYVNITFSNRKDPLYLRIEEKVS